MKRLYVILFILISTAVYAADIEIKYVKECSYSEFCTITDDELNKLLPEKYKELSFSRDVKIESFKTAKDINIINKATNKGINFIMPSENDFFQSGEKQSYIFFQSKSKKSKDGYYITNDLEFIGRIQDTTLYIKPTDSFSYVSYKYESSDIPYSKKSRFIQHNNIKVSGTIDEQSFVLTLYVYMPEKKAYIYAPSYIAYKAYLYDSEGEMNIFEYSGPDIPNDYASVTLEMNPIGILTRNNSAKITLSKQPIKVYGSNDPEVINKTLILQYSYDEGNSNYYAGYGFYYEPIALKKESSDKGYDEYIKKSLKEYGRDPSKYNKMIRQVIVYALGIHLGSCTLEGKV